MAANYVLRQITGRDDPRGIGAFRKTYSHLDVAPSLIVAPVSHASRLSADTFVIPWNVDAS